MSSVADTLYVTVAPAALVASAVSGPGTLNVGGVVSLNVTFTTNLPTPVLPWLSVALHVTVVCPTEKLLPDGGLHVAVSVPSTASVADTGAHVTTAVPDGLFAAPAAPPGTCTIGAVVSRTVTVAVAMFVPSLHVMLEFPSGKCAVAAKACPGPPVGVQVASTPDRTLTLKVTSAPPLSVASTGDVTSIEMSGGAADAP